MPALSPVPRLQPAFTPKNEEDLNEQHNQFIHTARKISGIAFLGSFILATSAVIIVCGGLCLTLPGVNVLSEVSLKAFLPGAGGILLSIPLLVKTGKLAKPKKILHGILIRNVYQYVYRAFCNSQLDKEDIALFIKDHLLSKEGNRDYKQGVLKSLEDDCLKKKEERSKEEEDIKAVLDEALKMLLQDKAEKPLKEYLHTPKPVPTPVPERKYHEEEKRMQSRLERSVLDF